MRRRDEFKPELFRPTQWDTVEMKAQFAQHFARFVRSGFNPSLFHKTFYRRLMNTRGHIAHYDAAGFYQHWFSSTAARLAFLRHWAEYPVYGDATCTYSDVEMVLREWVRDNRFVEQYRELENREIETNERAQLARLKAKYPGE